MSTEQRVCVIDGEPYVMPPYVTFHVKSRLFSVRVLRVGEPDSAMYFGANGYPDVPSAYAAACAYAYRIPEPIRRSLPVGIVFKQVAKDGVTYDWLTFAIAVGVVRRGQGRVALGQAGSYDQTHFNRKVTQAGDMRRRMMIEVRNSYGACKFVETA